MVSKKSDYILSTEALGDAVLTQMAKDGYEHLYGISDSKGIFSQEGYTKIKYLIAEKTDTHFPNSMFDIVYTYEAQEMALGSPSLREYTRITKNGGRILLMTRSGNQAMAIPIKKENNVLPKEINLICPSLGKQEGISEYTLNLEKKFVEVRIKAHLYKSTSEIQDTSLKTIIEYEPGLGQTLPDVPKGYIIEAHATPSNQIFWLELKNRIKGAIRDPNDAYGIFKLLVLHPRYCYRAIKRMGNKNALKQLQMQTLLVRNNELGKASKVEKYFIMPHIAYNQVEALSTTPSDEIIIGSFGFATESKNFDKICELAKRLGIKCILLASINQVDEYATRMQKAYAEKLVKKYTSDKITIETGFFTEDYIRKKLSTCSHLISAQNSALGVSGTLRFMASIGKPVISIDNIQSRDAQVHRVHSLSEIDIDYLKRVQEPIIVADGFANLMKVLLTDVIQSDKNLASV